FVDQLSCSFGSALRFELEESIQRLTESFRWEPTRFVLDDILVPQIVSRRIRTLQVSQNGQLSSALDSSKPPFGDFEMKFDYKSTSRLQDLMKACQLGDNVKFDRSVKSIFPKINLETLTWNYHKFRPIHWATIGGHTNIVRQL